MSNVFYKPEFLGSFNK